MRRIFLVRHGESMGNVDLTVHQTMPDHAIPLSPRGIVQANAAGGFLNQYLGRIRERYYTHSGKVMPVRLWTSPYRRTRQTAKCLDSECRAITSVREHIMLCEQQFGLFDGVPEEEWPNRFPVEHAHYFKAESFEGRFWARMPLGESRFDVAVRVHQAFGTFQRDAERHGIENIVVVCHGVTMRAFVMMWCHLTPEWFEAEPNPPNCAIRLIEDGEDKGYIFQPASDG